MTAALTLVLPEPPTVNAMLALARKMTRRGPAGAWMQKPQSRYWVAQQEYFLACTAAARQQRAPIPAEPWPAWRVVGAELRVFHLHDYVEAGAKLKWPIDWLKHAGIVADDSPRHLLEPPPAPTQRVARGARGLTLTIAPVTPDTERQTR